jgi:hypothetical protein
MVCKAMKTKVTCGWLVEVSNDNGASGNAAVRRFNIAEPSKAEAERSVRRRIVGAEGATVTALEGLSRHTVYNVLRLKRGEMTQVA